jgi:hypothetical protein
VSRDALSGADDSAGHDPAAGSSSSGIPEHPLAEGLLGTPSDREGARKFAGWRDRTDLTFLHPYIGQRSGDDRGRLWRYVTGNPDGTPLSKIVRDVFGDTTGDYTDAEYQRAYRLFTSDDMYEIRSAQGLNMVYPVPSALRNRLNLTDHMQSAKTATTRRRRAEPEATAKARLSRLSRLEDPVRGELLADLAAKRSGIDDKHLVLEREGEYIPEGEEEHLILPLATRLSSSSRASESFSKYRTAWERASSRAERGVVLTITTDPSRYDSISEACSSLMGDANRLRSWLAYSPDSGPSRPGERLDSIVVPEFTDSGLPHLHIAFFGASWLTTHDALKGYCAENLDRCSVVWADRIHRRGGAGSRSWAWESDPDAPAGGQDPETYLAEGLRARRETCSLSSDELAAAASTLRECGLETEPDELEDREGVAPRAAADLRRARGIWKVALYFATGLRFYTLSPELREPTPDGGLPSVESWSRIQIGHYGEIPGYIRDTSTVVSRATPPPSIRLPEGSDSGVG